jgi:putative ABC transport system permease protein
VLKRHRRIRPDADFEAELQAHLAMLVDEHVRRGLSLEEATRAARVRLGGLVQLTEERRERRRLAWVDTLRRDLSYAMRTFRRSPGFALVAIVTLALGIGVNTSAFTILDAVALKGLPVRDAANLFRIERWFASGARGDVQFAFSLDEYALSRDQCRSLAGIVAVSWPFPASAGDETLRGQLVSRNYFAELGVDVAGRAFTEGDRSGDPVVVVSHGFWRKHFGSHALDADATVRLNGVAFTIVGVAPEPFFGTGSPPQAPDFWAPIDLQPRLDPADDWVRRNGVRGLQILARVAPGAGAAQAQTDVMSLTG